MSQDIEKGQIYIKKKQAEIGAVSNGAGKHKQSQRTVEVVLVRVIWIIYGNTLMVLFKTTTDDSVHLHDRQNLLSRPGAFILDAFAFKKKKLLSDLHLHPDIF